MSLPYKFTTTSALRRPALLPSNLTHSPSRILLRAKHNKTGGLASRLVADNITKAQGLTRSTENETMAVQQKRSTDYALASGMYPLIPTTFVALPLSQLPSSFRDKGAYLWYRFRAALNTYGLVLGTKVDSMINWKTRPRYQARMAAIAPTAKIMYRELLEAFAAGDQAAIRNLCTPHLASQYNRAIERRPENISVRWEAVKYSGSPKLKSYMIIPMNPHDKEVLTEQAVVAITWTQRSSKFDFNKKATVPGSEREREGTEYVVLKREYSKKEWWTLREWQIWGTTEVTTLKKIQDEMEMVSERQREMAGWTKTDKKKA